MFYVNGDGLWPLYIVIGIAVIGIIVFLLRKYVPGLGNSNEVVDEKQAAEEEVNRYIVTEELPTKKEEKEDNEE